MEPSFVLISSSFDKILVLGLYCLFFFHVADNSWSKPIPRPQMGIYDQSAMHKKQGRVCPGIKAGEEGQRKVDDQSRGI